MDKKNGVTRPGSPLLVAEQDLGKSLPGVSSAPSSLHEPFSASQESVETVSIS